MDLIAFLGLAAGVIVAAFVQGTSGVGFALIVAPILGLVAPALLPVCLLILMLPLNAYVAWRERATVDCRGASWITLGRFVGTFGGLWILTVLSASYLNLLIGGVTILAAVTTLLAGPRQDRYGHGDLAALRVLIGRAPASRVRAWFDSVARSRPISLRPG
jgi:uncharacterized membrane protein YfcA